MKLVIGTYRHERSDAVILTWIASGVSLVHLCILVLVFLGGIESSDSQWAGFVAMFLHLAILWRASILKWRMARKALAREALEAL